MTSTSAGRPFGHPRSIAGWELTASVRNRWVVGAGIAFAVVIVAVVAIGLQGSRALGLAGVGPTTAALLGTGLLVPSLIALLLTSTTVAGSRERGDMPLLLTQPVSRRAIATGMFLGSVGALWLVVALGFGAGLVLVGSVVRQSDLAPLAALAGASLALTAVCSALGLAISAAARSRGQATAVALGTWLVLAFGIDLALAGLVPAMRMGPAGLLVVILADPIEAARILALLGARTDGAALGPFGDFLVGDLGLGPAIAVLLGSLAAWTFAAVALTARLLDRRDA